MTSLLGDGEGMAPAASTGSDFFDLGGRSIEAMVLAGRISTALGIRISMAGLFRPPRSVTWTAGSTSWLTLGSNQAKEWRQ